MMVPGKKDEVSTSSDREAVEPASRKQQVTTIASSAPTHCTDESADAPLNRSETAAGATMFGWQHAAFAQPQQTALQQVISFTDYQLMFVHTNALPTLTNIDTSSTLLEDNPRFPRSFESNSQVLFNVLEPRLEGYCEAVDEDQWSLHRFTTLLNGARQPARTQSRRPLDGESALTPYHAAAYLSPINDCINPEETPAAAAYNPHGGRQWSPVGLGIPLQTDWLLASNRPGEPRNRAIIEVKTPHTAPLVVFQAIDLLIDNRWISVGDDGFVTIDAAASGVFNWDTRERVRRILTQVWCQMIHYEVRIALLTTHCNTKVFYVDNDVIQVSRTIYQNSATEEDPCDSLFPLFLAVALLYEDETVLPRQYIGTPDPGPEMQEYWQGQVVPLGGAYLPYPGGYLQPMPGHVYYAQNPHYFGQQYQAGLNSPYHFSSIMSKGASSSAPAPPGDSQDLSEPEGKLATPQPRLKVDITAKGECDSLTGLDQSDSDPPSPSATVECSNDGPALEKEVSSVRETLDVKVISVCPEVALPKDPRITLERLGAPSLAVRLGPSFNFTRCLAEDVAHSLGKVRKWPELLHGPIDCQVLVNGPLPLIEVGPDDNVSRPTPEHAPQTIVVEEVLSCGLIWDCFSISTVPSFEDFPLVAKVAALDAFEETPDPKICHGPFSRDGLSRARARHAIANEYRALSYIDDRKLDIAPKMVGLWGGVQRGRQVWVLVMEKVGEQVDKSVITTTEKEQILTAYERLHDAGVLHGDATPRHWRRPLEPTSINSSTQSGAQIKIIDFDRAIPRAACKPEYWEVLKGKEMAKVRQELGLKES